MLGGRAMTFYDCQRCGACCVNTSENRAEGFTGYVEIEPSDAILRRRDLVKKLVILDDDGARMRLGEDGRCLALRGAIGRKVECSIYHHRPSPCRRVEAGSDLCLTYRRGQGL